MAKRKYFSSMNSLGSFIATLLFLYFLVSALVVPFINALGGIGEIITDLVELLPFGEAWYWIALQLINTISGQVVSNYPMAGNFSFSYLLNELCQGVFTVILYEAGCLLMSMIMGLEKKGRWIKLKDLAVKVGVAIIAACLAPALINYIFSGLPNMAQGWQIFISSLVTTILSLGGTAFFLFLYGLTLGNAALFVFLKFFVVGGLRLGGTYIFLMLFLLGCKNHLFSVAFRGLSGFLIVILLMSAIEMMLKPLTK